MAPFATPDDLAAYWRPLSDTERASAERLLRVASAVMRSRVPSLDERLADDELDPELPRYVAASMVRRVLTNPENVRQQSAGPLQITYATAEVHGLAMTDDELAMLMPGTESAGVGTIMTRPALADRWHRHCHPDSEWGWHDVH